MAGVVVSRINLVMEAGKAVPGPKIASVLGPRGIAMPKFCKEFNDVTSKGDGAYKQGDLVTAKISVYADKTYSFQINDSPVSYLLKVAAGIDKGSSNPGKEKAGKVKRCDVVEIAKRKMSSMNADTLEAAVRMVEGTARSMCIDIEE